MSDSAAHDHTHETVEKPLFSPTEVEQFSADDVSAGGAIGKMLSALFLYTVIAMGISSWWTYSSIKAASGESQESHSDQPQESESTNH